MTGNATGNTGAWRLAIRVLAAVVLGYVLANTTGTAIALALPATAVSGVVVGTLLTFSIWAAAVLWVFAQPSLKKAVIGLTSAIAVTGGIAGLLFALTQG